MPTLRKRPEVTRAKRYEPPSYSPKAGIQNAVLQGNQLTQSRWRAFWIPGYAENDAEFVRAHARALAIANPKNKKALNFRAFECYLAETKGFEPLMQLITAYSLSRGAPSASRSRLR